MMQLYQAEALSSKSVDRYRCFIVFLCVFFEHCFIEGAYGSLRVRVTLISFISDFKKQDSFVGFDLEMDRQKENDTAKIEKRFLLTRLLKTSVRSANSRSCSVCESK